jgi:hypothetical protein
MTNTRAIILRQEATAHARKRMFDMLVGFEPCRELKVGDIICIADWVSTITFDAIKFVDEEEQRP